MPEIHDAEMENKFPQFLGWLILTVFILLIMGFFWALTGKHNAEQELKFKELRAAEAKKDACRDSDGSVKPIEGGVGWLCVKDGLVIGLRGAN